MSLRLLIILSLLVGLIACNQNYDDTRMEVKEIIYAIWNLLNFLEKYYYQINLDGVLGLTLAEAQIGQMLYQDDNSDYYPILEDIFDKCQYLKQKMLPLLPEEPAKYRLFKNILLQPNFWYHKMQFSYGKLKDMGIYQNWTLDYILSKTVAEFNGVPTDFCLEEVLKDNYQIQEYKDCQVSMVCLVMMFADRIDTMYLLTHRLLYLQMARQTKCVMGDSITEELIQNYCSLIWKEAKTNEFLGFPQHDIFLEGVVLCGMEGFEEFMSDQWRRKIRNWQTKYGCYTPEDKNLDSIEKRSSNIIEFDCADHTTGLALAALTLQLRYKLTSHEKRIN